MNDLHERFLKYYRRRFPSQKNATLVAFVPMTHGLASDVYSVTIKQSNEQLSGLVLKSYTAEHRAEAARVAEREFTTLRLLAAAGYPVPAPVTLETGPNFLNKPFLLMERIDGNILWEVIEAQPDHGGPWITIFCQLFVDLHRLNWQPFAASLGAIDPRDPYSCVMHEIADLRRRVVTGGRPEFAPVVDWLARHYQDAACRRPSVLHRDYHPWNVIVTPDQRPVVIDWNSAVSDYRFDLAWTVQLLARAGFQDTAQRILAEYERLSQHPVTHLAYFEVAATVRWMLIVLHSLDTGTALRDAARADIRQFLTPMLHQSQIVLRDHTGIDVPIPV